MEIIVELKDLAFLVFISIAVWFSYRNGFKSGLNTGIDESIYLLESQGFIEVEELEDGELRIHKASTKD